MKLSIFFNNSVDLPLLLPTPELQEWIKQNIDIERSQWFLPPRKNTYADLTQCVSNKPKRQFKWNTLYYPPGVEWSEFYGLIDGQSLNNLSFSTNTKVTLNIQQDDTHIISVSMYLLPPVLLANVGQGQGADNAHGKVNTVADNLWVVRLVDERYFWQGESTGNTFQFNDPQDWKQLLNYILSSLNASYNIESGWNAAYGYASMHSDLIEVLKAGNAPMLLEAALWNLGLVMQRDLSGYYHIYSLSDATTADADGSAYTNAQERAGGKVALLSTGANPNIPATIEVYYPMMDNLTQIWNQPDAKHLRSPINCTQYYRTSVNTTDITSYQTGQPGFKKVFRDTARAMSSYGVVSNTSQLQALTVAIATDYILRKNLAGRDEVWNEIFVPTLNGVYTVEWEFGNDCHTRIISNWMNEDVEELMHDVATSSSYCSSSCCSPSCISPSCPSPCSSSPSSISVSPSPSSSVSISVPSTSLPSGSVPPPPPSSGTSSTPPSSVSIPSESPSSSISWPSHSSVPSPSYCNPCPTDNMQTYYLTMCCGGTIFESISYPVGGQGDIIWNLEAQDGGGSTATDGYGDLSYTAPASSQNVELTFIGYDECGCKFICVYAIDCILCSVSSTVPSSTPFSSTPLSSTSVPSTSVPSTSLPSTSLPSTSSVPSSVSPYSESSSCSTSSVSESSSDWCNPCKTHAPIDIYVTGCYQTTVTWMLPGDFSDQQGVIRYYMDGGEPVEYDSQGNCSLYLNETEPPTIYFTATDECGCTWVIRVHINVNICSSVSSSSSISSVIPSSSIVPSSSVIPSSSSVPPISSSSVYISSSSTSISPGSPSSASSVDCCVLSYGDAGGYTDGYGRILLTCPCGNSWVVCAKQNVVTDVYWDAGTGCIMKDTRDLMVLETLNLQTTSVVCTETCPT